MLLLRLLLLALMKLDVMNCGLRYRCWSNPNGEGGQHSIQSTVSVTTTFRVWFPVKSFLFSDSFSTTYWDNCSFNCEDIHVTQLFISPSTIRHLIYFIQSLSHCFSSWWLCNRFMHECYLHHVKSFIAEWTAGSQKMESDSSDKGSKSLLLVRMLLAHVVQFDVKEK